MAGTFVIAKARNGKFRFNLKATNKQVVLTSQLYTARASALRGIESARKNVVVDARFLLKTAKDGSPYFVLLARNGQVIGTSETYKSTAAMKKGIASVRANATSAKVVDET